MNPHPRDVYTAAAVLWMQHCCLQSGHAACLCSLELGNLHRQMQQSKHASGISVVHRSAPCPSIYNCDPSRCSACADLACMVGTGARECLVVTNLPADSHNMISCTHCPSIPQHQSWACTPSMSPAYAKESWHSELGERGSQAKAVNLASCAACRCRIRCLHLSMAHVAVHQTALQSRNCQAYG